MKNTTLDRFLCILEAARDTYGECEVSSVGTGYSKGVACYIITLKNVSGKEIDVKVSIYED